MGIAIWSSRYETGHRIIDSQHQALFGAINQLAESFRAGNSSCQVRESLAFLEEYTCEHFQTEEGLMREAGFAGLAEHAAIHAELVEQVRELQARLEGGQPATMEVMIFLADWLTHHIDEADMALVDFLKDQQRG